MTLTYVYSELHTYVYIHIWRKCIFYSFCRQRSFVTGFAKTVPNCTITEIHFIA